jgi:hypothetical protein
VFLLQIGAQWGLGVAVFVFAFAVLYGNARYALRWFASPSSQPPVRKPSSA